MKSLRIPLFDLHQDLMLHMEHRHFFGDHWQTNFDLLQQANTRACIVTAFPEPKNNNHLDPHLSEDIEKDFRAYRELAKKDKRFSLIQKKQDFDGLFDSEAFRCGLVLHIEGLNTFQGTSEDWDMLERWYDLGWRSVGLVWNITNALGGGTEDTSSGLTELGKEFLGWAQTKSMIIDCAHMNKQTFTDVVEATQGPLIISHGNAMTLKSDARNYTDGQLRIIAGRGGVVGAFFARKFVAETEHPTIDDVVNQIEYLVQLVGIDAVALGTDLGGLINGFVDGLESIDKIENLWEALRQKGFSKDDIEKIAYKNASRVIRSLMPSV